MPSHERDHYRALEVYLDSPDAKGHRGTDERRALLQLKTEEERNQWLKDKGLWDRFYQYPPHIRENIVGGLVQTGWIRHMVYMAWGRPYTRKKLPGREAQRSELLTYRFEELRDGTHQVWEDGSKTEYKAARLYSKELFVDDDVINEIQEKNVGW